MKQTVLLNLLLLVSTSLFAQVGIGTNNPKAMLDVASPTSGMLIPRYATLALANTKSLPTLNATDHRGLMIYVDEEVNRGFWFYDGSAFVKVGTPTTALPIANGGTGATTAGSALNALLPAQNGNTSKVLTSDGTNTSWQKPASRTRSISLGVGDFYIIPSDLFPTPTKQLLNQIPVLTYAPKSRSTSQVLVPIPADWNGTSPFTVTGFYTSTKVPGNFALGIGQSFLSLNMTVAITEYCEVVIPAASGTYALMEFTITLCSSPTLSSKVMLLAVDRLGNEDYGDTAAANFSLLGLRIDYQDK